MTNKCLCCGKELDSTSSKGWHEKCIKRFFESTEIPEVMLDKESIKKHVDDFLSKHHTITGVQPKLSLYLDNKKGSAHFTLVNHPNGYILKLNSKSYPCICEAEQLVMLMADISGIKTVPHGLVKLNKDNTIYITKRIDRVKDKKIHMEDFCQLLSRTTEYKYKSSYEKVASVIDDYSSRSGTDRSDLFEAIVFSFISGNSDMHLKNFSLLEYPDGAHLSPFYDLVPSSILLPSDKDQLALPINGKQRNLRRSDFIKYALQIKMGIKAANSIIAHLCSLKEKYVELVNESLLPDDYKKVFITLINQRIKVLQEGQEPD